eukprot:1746720-Rhodomonas_salina.1
MEHAFALRSAVLRERMVGGFAYGPVRLLREGQYQTAYGARICYAMSGTEIMYGAVGSFLGGAQGIVT